VLTRVALDGVDLWECARARPALVAVLAMVTCCSCGGSGPSAPTITTPTGMVTDPAGDGVSRPGVPVSPDLLSAIIDIAGGNLK
jgi:hypothetical protein